MMPKRKTKSKSTPRAVLDKAARQICQSRSAPPVWAFLAIAERVEKKLDFASQMVRGQKSRRVATPDSLCEAAGQLGAALGHAARVRILIAMLPGPASYQVLQSATACKAGPLYHHLNQLRLAGLIQTRQRDRYQLTRGGRNAILGLLAITSLADDQRER